jgi:hypothetical protein
MYYYKVILVTQKSETTTVLRGERVVFMDRPSGYQGECWSRENQDRPKLVNSAA